MVRPVLGAVARRGRPRGRRPRSEGAPELHLASVGSRLATRCDGCGLTVPLGPTAAHVATKSRADPGRISNYPAVQVALCVHEWPAGDIDCCRMGWRRLGLSAGRDCRSHRWKRDCLQQGARHGDLAFLRTEPALRVGGRVSERGRLDLGVGFAQEASVSLAQGSFERVEVLLVGVRQRVQVLLRGLDLRVSHPIHHALEVGSARQEP